MKLCMLDVYLAHPVSLNEAVCVLTARITAWSIKQWPCLVPYSCAFEGEFFSLFVFRLPLHAGASPWPVCGSQEAVSLTSMSEHGFTSLYIWYPHFFSLSFFFFSWLAIQVRSSLGSPSTDRVFWRKGTGEGGERDGGRYNRDPRLIFSVGGHREQFRRGQGRPFFDSLTSIHCPSSISRRSKNGKLFPNFACWFIRRGRIFCWCSIVSDGDDEAVRCYEPSCGPYNILKKNNIHIII